MKPDSIDWRDALSALIPQNQSLEEETSVQPEQSEAQPVKLQKLRIDIEKKGRAGKTATIISGFDLTDHEIANIAAGLKKSLGVGGSARGGEILIQGSRREEVIRELRKMGLIR